VGALVLQGEPLVAGQFFDCMSKNLSPTISPQPSAMSKAVTVSSYDQLQELVKSNQLLMLYGQ
jgi:hypothetical protein